MKIQLPEKVNRIITTLQKHGFEAYAVGGCVRDSFLGEGRPVLKVHRYFRKKITKKQMNGTKNGMITKIHRKIGRQHT